MTTQTAASSFVNQHFLWQEERPRHLGEVEIAALDPFLRGLLFTDGTVTRALTAETLTPVSVGRISQSEAFPLPADVAGHLEAGSEEWALMRRVGISVGAGSPAIVWAESHIVPDRLPPGFVGLLDGASDGIGQSLQRIALESCRELLWFGFDAIPEWADPPSAAGGEAITRLYRIVSERRPAILISESFAVERCGECLQLRGFGRGIGTEEAGGRR
jgi:chorismate-pyruvate lyase